MLDQYAVWVELLSFLAFEELRGRVPSDGHFRVDSGVERFSSGAFGATLLTQFVRSVTQHDSLVIAEIGRAHV